MMSFLTQLATYRIELRKIWLIYGWMANSTRCTRIVELLSLGVWLLLRRKPFAAHLFLLKFHLDWRLARSVCITGCVQSALSAVACAMRRWWRQCLRRDNRKWAVEINDSESIIVVIVVIVERAPAHCSFINDKTIQPNASTNVNGWLKILINKWQLLWRLFICRWLWESVVAVKTEERRLMTNFCESSSF